MIETKEFQLNRDYWNVVKGIGIISVIIGHACMWSQHVIYLYHLQIFFFASGYFYSEKKYGDHPFLNVKNKFKTTWKSYVILCVIVILLHNILMDLGLQPLAYERYQFKDFVRQIALACIGDGSELMAGPAWFLAILVLTSVMMGYLIFITRLVEKKTGSTILKIVLQAIVVIVLAAIGYRLVLNQIHFVPDIQYCFVVLPYMWLGYIIRNYIGDVRRFLNPICGLLAALIVYKVSTYEWVDITIGHVFSYMHIVCFIGIYMCLCLAEVINNIPKIVDCFKYFGINSMAIMIIHFPVLRLIDKFIANVIYKDTTGELFNHIPVAFENMWPVYLLVDIPVTLLIVWLWNKGKLVVKKNER